MRTNAKKSLTWLRRVSQGTMLLVVIIGAALRNGGIDAIARWVPELQGLCPFGATTTLGKALADPAGILDPHRANVWILVGILLVSALGGAVFCGWLCPLGAVQEWIGRLGRKVLGKRYDSFVDAKWSKRLGFLRYMMLSLVLVSAFGWLAVPLDQFNPSYALVHAWSSAVPLAAIALLILVLVASFFMERPWCRFLCPLGGVISIVGRIGLLKARRDDEACISCGACDRACPAGIAVSSTETVRNDRCTSCLACVASCPVPGVLSFAPPRKTGIPSGLDARSESGESGKPDEPHHPVGQRSSAAVRTAPAGTRRTWLVAAAAIALFFAPLAVARLAGWYSPAGHPATGEFARGDDGSPAVNARVTASELSPRMSLSEAATALGVDRGALFELLGLPADYDAATTLMDVELDEAYEHLSFGAIRQALEGLSPGAVLD